MDIIKTLKGDLKEYTSYPFWSWNNELDEHELVRQMREFKSAGIDGVIIHARTGLKTEYLGDKWFSCVEACLQEAKKSDMRVIIYDENGWPSGFVEGRLLQDGYYAQYLEYKVLDEYDAEAAAVYSLDGGKATRLKPGQTAGKYHCIYIRDNHNYTDIMNPELTAKFIAATHDEYYKRFADSFGREIYGFFTDEPQYFRYATPYSRGVPQAFSKEYGADVADGLVYLFMDTPESYEFRVRYYRLLNKLLNQNYYRPIYDWCSAHSCISTGHMVEENTLYGQMWGSAGAMGNYEYMHMPGMDWLGRDIGSFLGPKQVGSAAQQLGAKFVLTETFGCSGWDTTPRELRRITEFQYVNGVNSMCQHLASYSLKGQGKNDYPPSFTRHNVWINGSKPFNDYFKRLSYLLSNSSELVNTLVIHPMQSVYLTYDRKADRASVAKLQSDTELLIDLLASSGIQYHLGDEEMLARMAKLSGGKITVGKASYNYIVVPNMKNIKKDTLELIEKFQQAGGSVLALNNPEYIDGVPADVQITSNITIDDIPKNHGLKFSLGSRLAISHRKGGDYELIYVCNLLSGAPEKIVPPQGFSLLDLSQPAAYEASGEITLQPDESCVLIKGGGIVPASTYPKESGVRDVTDSFAVSGYSDNCLTLDQISLSFDGENFEQPVYIYAANERLIKQNYSGKLYYRYAFEVQSVPAGAKLLLEDMPYSKLTLNGQNLKARQSEFDVYFVEADAHSLKEGTNVLEACIDYFQKPVVKQVLYGESVLESLKNCLVIDTEICSAYLLGAFAVDGARRVTEQAQISGTDKLQEKGLPNFAGQVKLQGKLTHSGGGAALRLSGRYMSADVYVNGKLAAVSQISATVDLSGHLKEGENLVEIAFSSSMRNMLGPHHYAPEKDPHGQGPFMFNLFGTWEGGKSKFFSPDYALVDFGIDSIELIELD